MFKNKITLNFFVSVILGLGIYIFQKLKIPLPNIINNYANDFLIIPIVLSLCLYVLQYTRKNKNYRLPIFIIVYLCSTYAIFFEFFIPKTLIRYTGDFIDVVLYFLGGFWFYILQKCNYKN